MTTFPTYISSCASGLKPDLFKFATYVLYTYPHRVDDSANSSVVEHISNHNWFIWFLELSATILCLWRWN